MHEKGKLRSNQFWSALKISRLLPGNQILLALLASGLIGHSLSLLKSCNYFSEILPLTCIIKTLGKIARPQAPQALIRVIDGRALRKSGAKIRTLEMPKI